MRERDLAHTHVDATSTHAGFRAPLVAVLFDPKAATPKSWATFIDEVFEDDQESIDTVQEIMGYIVSGDLRQEKLFLFLGPTAPVGKGVISRVTGGLVGKHNVVNPTTKSMVSDFGRADLIGMPLAVMADVRITARHEGLAELLLNISGRDPITIERKFKNGWTGRRRPAS